jgi:hypothetical protein
VQVGAEVFRGPACSSTTRTSAASGSTTSRSGIRSRSDDRTNAERQKRYRDRQKASRNGTRNATRNGAESSRVTPRNAHEEEVEVKPPTPFAVDFEDWLLHYEQTTGHKLPSRGTKAFHSIAESYNARRLEGHTAEDVRDAIDGAHFDEFRRLNGYDTADSVLRPTKIGALIARGRRHRLTHAAATEDRSARFRTMQGPLQ